MKKQFFNLFKIAGKAPLLKIGVVVRPEKPAFTLSEVLITLGVIGVVAAITMPILVKNYRQHVLKTQFNAAVATVQNVLKLMNVENNEFVYDTYFTSDTGFGEPSMRFRRDFFKHIKGDYTKYDKNNLKTYYTFAKGSTTMAHYCPINCCNNPVINSYTGTDGIMYNVCMRENLMVVAFDVNGYDKGPNKWGVDLFSFIIGQNDRLNGLYHISNTGACSNDSSKDNVNNGSNCGMFALIDKNYFKNLDF